MQKTSKKLSLIALHTEQGEEQLEEVFYRNFKNMQGILFASRMDKFINGSEVLPHLLTTLTLIMGFTIACLIFDLN